MNYRADSANRTISENMRALRLARGWGQREMRRRLAERGYSWSKATYSLAETSCGGTRVRRFDADLISALASIFGVSVSVLFSEPADDLTHP